MVVVFVIIILRDKYCARVLYEMRLVFFCTINLARTITDVIMKMRRDVYLHKSCAWCVVVCIRTIIVLRVHVPVSHAPTMTP